MIRAYILFDNADVTITNWMKKYGTTALRISLGIIFVWFGLLKILGASPVEQFVASTVYWFSSSWFVPFLGWWEVVIGLCFLIRPMIRVGILLLIPQMIGTFLPLFILPHITFQGAGGLFVLFPTVEGEFIVKNFVLLSAAIVIGSQVRDPKIDDEWGERRNHGR